MVMHDEQITDAILGSAIEVHRHLGPGLLEVAQLLTYMRLSGRKTGLLLNFKVRLLKDGIVRRVL